MKILPPELDDAMEMSAANPLAAAKVLSIAAEYLRKGEVLPSGLAFFLADAIERAMKKSPSVRGSELLINLKLKALNRRPAAAHFALVGHDLEQLLAEKTPVLEATEAVASRHAISESTVRRRHKVYLEHKAFEIQEDGMINEALWRDDQVPK